MASWGTPPTFVLGEPIASTDLNTVSGDLTFLYQAPYVSRFNNSATTVNNGTYTHVTLGGANFEGYGWVYSSSNLVVPLTGVYSINWRIAYTGGGASAHGGFSALYQNGGLVATGSTVDFANSSPGLQSVGACVLTCTANDTLALYAYQNSGNTVTTATGQDNTALEAFFVGSQ